MTRLGVLTSGGDAPGMNAAIRAVTRSAVGRGWTVSGVEDGYDGLMAGRARDLGPRQVGGVLDRAGTLLGSARAPAMRSDEGQLAACRSIERLGLDALVVIGGGGSQAGAAALTLRGVPVVGVASTIDNDLVGSDPTLGVDTALTVALEAIDRLRATAASHRRVLVAEVMGRDCGYLALAAAVAGGAEAVVLPELPPAPGEVREKLESARALGKAHAIVVVAEGAAGGAAALAGRLGGFDVRVTVLGHVQRGARPTLFDRLLGTRLGVGAVDALASGVTGVLVGHTGGAIVHTPLADVVGVRKPLEPDLLRLWRQMDS